MTNIIIPTYEAYMHVIKQLKDEGKINIHQYGECLRRYKKIKDGGEENDKY